MVVPSILRKLLLPPAYSEAMTPAQWRRIYSLLLTLTLTSIVVDVGIWLALNGHEAISATSLRSFLAINVTLLGATAAYYLLALRLASFQTKWAISVCGVFAAITTLVWIQLTGTLNSYFLIGGVLLILTFRAYIGFGPGASVTATLVACHLGMVILESAGVLRPRSLFLSAAGQEYEMVGYRAIVTVSIACVYVTTFMITNLIVNKSREKDQALAEVLREMARVAEGAKHGRLSGTVLCDKYALGELLGRGGMGEVYKARRIAMDDDVAVKVLHAHLVDDDTMLERFRREAKLAERVPAQFTARVLDVGSDQEQSLHFIAMDYLRGEDLGAYLRRHERVHVQVLLPMAHALATALDGAHAAGVVHRDLKPQNTLLVREPAPNGETSVFPYSVRLLDFGVSKLLVGHTVTLTQADALLGTPGYMAPEQALGIVDDVGPAADRFALGAILYRALTGRPPFSGPDLLSTLRNVVSAHPLPPSSLVSDVLPDVDAVFVIAMAKRAADRYDSARDMVTDLTAAVDGNLSPDSWRRALKLGGLSVSVMDDRERQYGTGVEDPIDETLTEVGA